MLCNVPRAAYARATCGLPARGRVILAAGVETDELDIVAGFGWARLNEANHSDCAPFVWGKCSQSRETMGFCRLEDYTFG